MQSSLEVTYEITIKVLDFESVLYQLPQDFSSNVLKYSPAAALISKHHQPILESYLQRSTAIVLKEEEETEDEEEEEEHVAEGRRTGGLDRVLRRRTVGQRRRKHQRKGRRKRRRMRRGRSCRRLRPKNNTACPNCEV